MKLTGTLNFHYKIGSIQIVPIGATIKTTPKPTPSPTSGKYPVGTDIEIPLKHFFFRYSSTASDEGEGSTDANGDFEIDVTPGSTVTLEIFAHNAAVRAGKYPAIALSKIPGFDPSISIKIENAFTATPATHPVTLSDLTPGLNNAFIQDFKEVKTAFITAILLQDSYQHGFKEFTPWRKPKPVAGKISDNDFPVGYKTTREDNDQIEVLIPGLTVKLPYTNPNPDLSEGFFGVLEGADVLLPEQLKLLKSGLIPLGNPTILPGNPTIHFDSNPGDNHLAHEFGHALQSIISSKSQRGKIFGYYVVWLIKELGPTHDFVKHTTAFVAFHEAFAMFAGTFYLARQLFSLPIGVSKPTGVAPADPLHPEHHEHHRIFYHLYRKNIPPAGGTSLPPGGTKVPDISNISNISNPPDFRQWPSAPLEEVEGAIFSALYIDYAKRDSIGLDFVITSYMQSKALTLLEYVNWIRDRYGRYSPQYIELFDVMTKWGMLTNAGLTAPGKFLRTPVSEESLSSLANLEISEITTSSNPKYGDPPSGGMELTWDSGTDQPVEISPLFGGWVCFLADSDPIKPVGLIDATMSEYSDWTVTGRLSITSFGGYLKRDFLAHLPGSLIPNPPDAIMYEPIRLTPEFFSETLAKAALVEYSEGTVPPPSNGSISFNKLVYEFINGRARMQSGVEVPLKVVTDTHKTVVRAGLSKEYLWVTTFTRSSLVLDKYGFWWLISKANDLKGLPSPTPGSVEPIIHSSFISLPAANLLKTQTYDPLHPNHTVVPLWMLLHEVGNTVLFDDPTTHPILTAISTSNKKHRRIELKRWNSEKGGSPEAIFERQYPFFQVIVTSSNDSSTIAARVPASGVVFLSLETGIHSFKVAPRWELPPDFGGNTQAIFISLDSGGLVIPPGNASVNVDITPGTEVVELYISSVEYDSNIAWESLTSEVDSGNYGDNKKIRVGSGSLNIKGNDVTDAFLPVYFSGVIEDHFRSHQLIYGLALESAGRHDLSPELIMAVMFAAGLDKKFPLTVNGPISFDPHHLIQGPEIGLYNIGNTYPSLVSNGYIDTNQVPPSVLENERTISTGLEAGSKTADIRGWEAAIELVAATLHEGLDYLTIEYHNLPTSLGPGPCGSDSTKFHTPPIPNVDGDAPLILAIFSYLPRPASIDEKYAAYYLGCFVDKTSASTKMSARKWDVKDSNGMLRYPTGPADSSFSDYENIRYQILCRLATTLALKDSGGFA